jgi:hypothetical protein
MHNTSHRAPRPAAGLIARLRQLLGLARMAHPSKQFLPTPDNGPASAGPEASPQNLAGRWPDTQSVLARRIGAMRSTAAPDSKGDHPPAA